MVQSPAVMTRGLTKSYGDVQALRGVNLEVRRGEVFGFLGPNGSGKTTTIRCLLDLIRPDGGVVRVLGLDPQAEPLAVRARLGYLPGELRLDDNLTADAALRFFNRLRGGRADWPFVRQLSGAPRPRPGHAHQEPLQGEQAEGGAGPGADAPPGAAAPGRADQRTGPAGAAGGAAPGGCGPRGGATVFFSSHALSEVQETAERVAIIREGAVVEVAETAALINRALRRVRIRFRQPVEAGSLASIPGVRLLEQDERRGVVLQVEGEMDALIKALAAFPVSDFETERPSLEEIFLAYYADEGGEVRCVPIFREPWPSTAGKSLGWGGILFLIGLVTIPAYDVVKQNPESIRKMVEQFPPELLALFSRMDQLPDLKKWDPSDPAVFLDMNFFAFMPLILGVFAVLGGSGLVVSDEENGTLDLVLAHPVRRTSAVCRPAGRLRCRHGGCAGPCLAGPGRADERDRRCRSAGTRRCCLSCRSWGSAVLRDAVAPAQHVAARAAPGRHGGRDAPGWPVTSSPPWPRSTAG